MGSKQSRILLMGLAAAVIVGVAVLVIMLKKGAGDSGPAVAKPTGKGAAAPPTAPGVIPTRAARDRPTVTKGAAPKSADPAFRTSINPDGVVVRDHRAKGAAEVTTPIRRPVTAGKMKPLTIAAVRDALRPLVRKCEADHAPEVEGDRPMLQAVVRVSVEGDRVLAGETEVTVRDVKADALMDCVKRAARDIDIPAGGHADIKNYALTFPFRLARKAP